MTATTLFPTPHPHRQDIGKGEVWSALLLLASDFLDLEAKPPGQRQQCDSGLWAQAQAAWLWVLVTPPSLSLIVCKRKGDFLCPPFGCHPGNRGQEVGPGLRQKVVMGVVATRTQGDVTSSCQVLEATLHFSHPCHVLGPYGKDRTENSDWLTPSRPWMIIASLLLSKAE